MFRNQTIAVLLALLAGAPVGAADYHFADDEKDMIRMLGRDGGASARTRGLKSKSLWDTAAPEPERLEVKSIMMRDNGDLVERSFRPVPRATVNLKIQFDFDSSTIRRDSIPLINRLGRALTSDELRGGAFSVNGHTDSDGGEDYNLHLSVRRAMAVKSYLVAKFNISPAHLKVAGFGEFLPLKDNSTAENRQLNRRVGIEKM